MGKQDKSKYVDMELVDVDIGDTKHEKDNRIDERIQMSVLINSRSAGAMRSRETNHKLADKTNVETKMKEDSGDGRRARDITEGLSDPPSSSYFPCLNAESEDCFTGDKIERNITQPEVSKNTPGDKDLHCGDNYLGERNESDDNVSLVLSDDSLPGVTEDESHYITTHEIQLSELSDNEEDYDLGVGSSTSWDVEDESQVYSFVDYGAFDGEGEPEERGDAHQPRSQGAVSTLLENDLCDAAKFTSLDESLSKPLQQQHCNGNGAGQIHLSIRTTSRAINDPSNIQEKENILYHAMRSRDMSRYVFRGVDGKAGTLSDRTKCFIAAPGRLHFGRKFSGKEVTEYSSGASSVELDDADKEVRNLTAKAFKSLAYPYFDAINFSTSSESSTSEQGKGINRWSTFVDLKYGNMNMSQGLNQRVVSHQNSTTSFEIAKNIDNRGCSGIALASTKPPTGKIFTLNANPHNASASSEQIELMGKLSQGHGGVIRLTETLNFRCNVKSGMSGGERLTNFSQNATGSRSTDEVTNSFPSSQRRGASKSSKTMEDTHKKAIFASSLIKNVISKKMQFEQERKMERGEISETHPTPSPCFAHQESDRHREKGSGELHSQSSKFSESSSDFAIMCVDELGDIIDSGSCKSDSRRQDTAGSATGTNLKPTNEDGFDTKKGALEASKGILLRSQNSAFRCWKDEELEFQRDHKNDKTPAKSPSANDKDSEGDQYTVSSGKLTKMSHLFVPSIQLLSSEGEVGHNLQKRNYFPHGDGEEIKVRSDNTMYFADARSVATSKSPEIKINLRSVRDNKTDPFGVSKLRTPNIACNATSLVRTDDFKCHALGTSLKGESSEKVPHFMVRDIRDNKGKLQTPIHQVRDVRKLVKSSYHFVSLDNNENKSNFASADSHSEQKNLMSYRNPNSISPIVIKCQSVNTNSNRKCSGSLAELPDREPHDMDRSSPDGAKNVPLQRAAGRAPIGNSNNFSARVTGLKIESMTSPMKQEKISDITDKKPESKIANQGALEKLQAAVKTMEQLYVFERNEWKRKDEPHVLTDSHVLSLIASEEHGGHEEEGMRVSNLDKTVIGDYCPNNGKTPPAVAASPGTEGLRRQEDKPPSMTFHTPDIHDNKLVAMSVQTTNTTGNKNLFSLPASSKGKAPQPNTITQTPFCTKSFMPKPPKLPVSLKISQMKISGNEEAESKEVEGSSQELLDPAANSENYLTIPVMSQASSNKQASAADKTSVYTFTNQTQTSTPSGHLGSSVQGLEERNKSPKCSSIVMNAHSPESPSATIYHSLPLGMAANQPQVYCFSPAITPAPTLDPFQATQRKMLLDPTTGNYYLVDTPIQPATKRLFDPETSQYVDVPMPQPPMTPVPMPLSPLALSSGAYGHTYMIYPGFMPTPSMIPARTLVQSHVSLQSEVESGEKALSQQNEGMYLESPLYMATANSPQVAYAAQPQTTISRPPQGFSSIKQPVISITSQQGPRIIAPPSFDGTTMSFVVEHR